jgi:hypothetical protein
MMVDLAEPSRVPSYAEPWFFTFNANVEFHAVMTPDDLARAGAEALGKTRDRNVATATPSCSFARAQLSPAPRTAG